MNSHALLTWSLEFIVYPESSDEVTLVQQGNLAAKMGLVRSTSSFDQSKNAFASR